MHTATGSQALYLLRKLHAGKYIHHAGTCPKAEDWEKACNCGVYMLWAEVDILLARPEEEDHD